MRIGGDLQALAALLDWYVESGVDLALDEAPHDRYAESLKPVEAPVAAAAPTPRAPPGREPAPRPRPAPAIAAPDDAARAAEEAAANARTLDELAAALADFPYAPFREMARHFLLFAGTPGAPLMVLDGAPGVAEESTGEAFCGEQARLLDNMLKAIGRGRDNAYLAYVSPWRPPGVMAMTPQQLAIFAPFARRHVELARPEVVLLFGEAPARAMIAASEPLGKLRGRPFDIECGAHRARAYVFSSLDSMLKQAALKPAAWRDLRAAASSLSPLAGRGLG
ncbi:uracil-DNA glycosylase [Methylocystis parvus]|uniref:Uracil-DNA glycosylase n=1 Tax=Methylocystis parvus TaxID=134 RepID=A0A6B8M746_9HYPH|nr:uracil-DNA glycosylase [Methylocystis parvus]QGM97153.1 uracil-DNA glycosylase [Methylocystis parvus]WBJ98942.1 uracil-DNA glycosylase [Methylocystis parvus OBBP]